MPSRLIDAVFAGDRRVWRWATVAGLPLIVLVVVWCLVPRGYYTGTDSVNALSVTAPVPAGQRACARGLNLPAGTTRVELVVTSGQFGRSALQMTMQAGNRTYRSSAPAVATTPAVIDRVDFPIPRLRSARPSVPASLCLRAAGIVAWGVTPTTEGIQPPLTVNGTATLARLAVWFRPQVGAQRSYFSEANLMFERAARFAPGFARPWLFGFVFFVLLPLVALLAVRCLAVAATGATRRMGLWVYVLVALNCAAWAVITPAFQAPDEVDHFAYVQSLVERGQSPTTYPSSTRLRWSTAEDDALRGSGMITDHQSSDSRAPWLSADVDAFHRLLATTGTSAADGGGYTGASGYGPLYYLAVAPGYLIASGSSTFSQLALVRLFSVLIGALTSLFTYLVVRELAPRRPWLAVLAGLLVGFQPMYAFLSGTVNNDIGIDAGAAAVFYLLVRIVCRGIDWRTTLPLGLLLGLLPFVKASAFDLYPLTVLALAGALWRYRADPHTHRGRTVRDLVVLALPAAVGYVGAGALTSALRPPAPSHGALAAVDTASSTITTVLHAPGSYLAYLWEMFLPRLPFMAPHFPAGEYPVNTIFVRRGWAAFGWYDTFFPGWVYRVLFAAMVLTAVLGLVALWRHRDYVRSRVIETTLIVLLPIIVAAGFAAVFYTPGRPVAIAEHGRYEFPALAALSASVIGALHAFGRERMIALGTVLLVAMLGLGFASQLLTFVAFNA